MQINTILIQLIRFSEKTATEEEFQLQPMETVFRRGLVFCSSKERNNLFGVVLPSSSSFHALIAPFLDIFLLYWYVFFHNTKGNTWKKTSNWSKNKTTTSCIEERFDQS